MRRLSSKQTFYGFCAGILVTFAVTGLIMYWANSQLEARKSQITLKKIESQELEAKIDRAKTLREELAELRDTATVSSEVLPNKKSQENIIGELISIAANRGLSLETISFEGGSGAAVNANPETSQAESVKEIPGVFSLGVQTSIVTDYENILRFLEDIENNKRQIEVTDISITPNPTDPNQFDAQLTMVTYIQP